MSSDTTSSKILTDDYCKWHSNLVDLPSSQTDKIHSRLYKAYMEETGLDPWIKSETSESSQLARPKRMPIIISHKIALLKFPSFQKRKMDYCGSGGVITHNGGIIIISGGVISLGGGGFLITAHFSFLNKKKYNK
ncbi:hypothetical protein C2G38_2160401 [Gigaspora rosea]|uniref:Uncharacterized protein n=1 Tax=Gigaspora rosea TaxID=44941 RepID=A0A397W5I7_9GLOM|nr:hypothetical protein C2G38_2160401 [Gigaspora rosea]